MPFKSYPVHRLDFATEGLLVWAKNSEAAGELSKMNRNGEFEKLYHCVIRGHITPASGFIEIPLLSDASQFPQECKTEYETLKTIEIPVKINSEFPTSRYSLMKVRLHTGRWHQIRRHFIRVAHPIIGDRLHGDSHHNRYFRDELKLSDLLLRAYELSFTDPFTLEKKKFRTPDTENWKCVLKIFEVIL